jgi:hypothetical protein
MYEWKDTNTTDFSWMAEDVEKECEFLVRHKKNSNGTTYKDELGNKVPEGIHEHRIPYLIISALQQLKPQIDRANNELGWKTPYNLEIKNVSKLGVKTEDIYKLNAKSFQFKMDDKYVFDYIVDEVEEVFPQIVTRDSRGVPTNYSPTKLVPLIIEEMKKLKDENMYLKMKLNELETDIKRLKK